MKKHMFAPGVIDASPTAVERRKLARRWATRIGALMCVLACVVWLGVLR